MRPMPTALWTLLACSACAAQLPSPAAVPLVAAQAAAPAPYVPLTPHAWPDVHVPAADPAPGKQTTPPADTAPPVPTTGDAMPEVATVWETLPKPKSCQDFPQDGKGPVDQLPPNLKTSQPASPTAVGTPDSLGEGHAIQVFGAAIYALDRDAGRLIVLDRISLTVLRNVEVGARPGLLALQPDGTAWVTVRGPGLLVRVGVADQAKPSASFPVGRDPVGLQLRTVAGQLAEVDVALAGESAVVAIAPQTGAELWRAQLPQPPYGVVLAGQGLAASMPLGGAAWLPLPEAGVASAAPIVQTVPLRVQNPAHSFAQSQGQELPNLAPVRAFAVAGGADALVAHVLARPGENKPQVQIVSSGGYGSSDATNGWMSFCERLPVRPMEVAVTRIEAGQSGAPAKAGAQAVTAPVADPQTWRNALARYDQPSAIRRHPTRSLALVTAQGTDNVLVLNTGYGDPMRWPVAELRVSQGPLDVAVTADGTMAYVLAGQNGQVDEVELAPLLALPVPAPGTLVLLDAPLTLNRSRTQSLPPSGLDANLRQGRRIFTYAGNPQLARAGRMACASCHPDGSQDGQVWIVPQGPRQTPLLAGRLADTAPYGWNGEFETMEQKISFTIEHNLGGQGLTAPQLAALQAWLLKGLPEPQVTTAPLTADQEAGKALFESVEVGCGSCHAAGIGTDGSSHDVGTVSELEKNLTQFGAKPLYDTPSLRAVGATAPYLHDGSAATLAEVLEKTKGKMGHVETLTDAQKLQLIAYLQTL